MPAPEAAKLPHKHYFLPVKQVLECAIGIPKCEQRNPENFQPVSRSVVSNVGRNESATLGSYLGVAGEGITVSPGKSCPLPANL